MNKYCVVCGRLISKISLRRDTCSRFCLNRKKAGHTPYEKSHYKEIDQIKEQAKKYNMTYGQYLVFLSMVGVDDE